MESNKSERDFQRAVLVTLEEIVLQLQPLGINAARAVVQKDPRLPKPVGLVQRPIMFAGDQAREYLARVAREGFPHEA